MYQVVFDTAAAGFHTWRVSAIGLPFVAFGLLAAVLVRRSPRSRLELRFANLAAAAGIIIGAYLCVTSFVAAHREYRELASAISTGHYQTVEGTISDYTPQGPGEHPPESWSVAGHHYTLYSQVTSAFSEAGRVRAGQQVRIADVKGRIARLEIAR